MPKKRKASSSGDTPAKKVRIGGASNIPNPPPTVSPAGRPKRSTVGEPQYNFTRRRSSTAQNATPTPTETEVGAKKRGRPSKATIASPVATQRGAPKKGARKNGAGSTAAKSTTKASARNDRSKAPAHRVARPGRPKKAQASTATSALLSESDSEDIRGLGGAATPAVTGDPQDLETVDHDIQYWLMKAEPESRIEKGHDVKFSIDDLAAKNEPEGWDGVRNAVARNNMRAMRKGDLAFFYHSNCTVPGVAGVMRIVAEHSVDESAFDPEHPYYDAKSDREKPKWELVHVEFVKKFDHLITLKDLRTFSKPGGALEGMQMLKQSRLSVSSVSPAEWRFILELAGENISLGHGDGKGGYESDVDGEGEETAADETADIGVGDASNGWVSDERVGDGLGITVANGPEIEI